MTPTRRVTARYPLCRVLGDRYKRLTAAEMVAASADERIDSVWPMLMAKARAFASTLKPGQRANMDIEDILADLYVELRQKDCKWLPEAGAYTTFSAKLASHLFSVIRDSSRTVHSPRNSGTRLQDYEEARAGESGISDRMALTEAKIKGTQAEYAEVDGTESGRGSSPEDEASDAEEKRRVLDAVVSGLLHLSPYEAAVLGARHGLWGRKPRSIPEIAEGFEVGEDEIKSALCAARRKFECTVLRSPHADYEP